MSYMSQPSQLQSKPSYLQDNKQQTFSTNQIFYQISSKNHLITYYLPSYLQLKFNNITSLDFKALQSKVNCQFTFRISVLKLGQSFIQFLKNNMKFQFTHDETLQLKIQDQNQIEIDQEKDIDGSPSNHYHYIVFKIRKEIVTTMMANIMLTPFQIIHLIISIAVKANSNYYFQNINTQSLTNLNFPSEIQELYKKENKLKQVKFAFNLMDCQHRANTIYYQTLDSFGLYAIAFRNLSVQFTNKNACSLLRQRNKQINSLTQNSQGNTKKVEKAVDYFQYSHFIISLYRSPASAIFPIIVPTIMLSFISIIILKQDKQLGGRVANLSNLTFAFITLIPIIRLESPASPDITFMELILYQLLATSFLCLVESFIDDTHTSSDIFFVIACVVAVSFVGVISMLLMWHYFVREHQLKGQNSQEFYTSPTQKFDHKSWTENHQCHQYFSNLQKKKQQFYLTGSIKNDNSIIQIRQE